MRGSARTCMLATWPNCTRLRRERPATCATQVGAGRRMDGRWVVGVGRASSGRCRNATNGLAASQARAPHLAKGTGSQGGATPASGKRRPSFYPHSQPTAYCSHATQPTVPSAKRSQSAPGVCRRSARVGGSGASLWAAHPHARLGRAGGRVASAEQPPPEDGTPAWPLCKLRAATSASTAEHVLLFVQLIKLFLLLCA